MAVTYYRRFRMEFNLRKLEPPEPQLPRGYYWVPWSDAMVDRHAQVKFESFRSEIDSHVFTCLGDTAGCQRLMHEISRQRTFLPQTTWLIACWDPATSRLIDCATIQGLAQSRWMGSIQNVGVAPQYRGLGLGRALVLKALRGFRQTRLRRVYLEVTADNVPAVELYRSVGFRLIRTTYKAVDVEPVPVC